MAIIAVSKAVDRNALERVGFQIGPAEWVEAIIESEHIETNKYEAILSCENGDQLSVILYFDEDSTTLLGVDEVVHDHVMKGFSYKLETTPAWEQIKVAVKKFEEEDAEKQCNELNQVEYKRPSYAQDERQQTRGKNGRYTDMAKCEICNKSVGANYYSDERVDSKFHGLGLTLCKKDAHALANLSDDEAFQKLREAEEKRNQPKE
ncbi:hypothetical protein [Paenibacillus taichungensis]